MENVIRAFSQSSDFAPAAMLSVMTDGHTTFESRPLTPDAIKDALKRAKKTQQELANFLHYDLHVVNRLLNGKRTLRHDEAVKIRNFLAHAGEELERDGERQDAELINLSDYTPRSAAEYEVTLYGAGSDDQIRLDASGRIGLTRAHPAQTGAAKGFAVQIFSDDNAPRFETGDIAYGIRSYAPRRDQDCFVELKDGTAHLGRYDGRTESAVRLRMIGSDKVRAYPLSEVRAVHAVVGRG